MAAVAADGTNAAAVVVPPFVADWVVFLNDIAFTWEGMAKLIATPLPYDMVCGMDAQLLKGGGE